MTNVKVLPRSGRDFQAVPISALQGAKLRRLPSSATVTTTGRTRLNANGSTDLSKLAHEAGLDPSQFHVTYGVDEAGQQVAIYAAAPGTPGASPVRIHKGQKAMTIHLSGVFKSHPSLRVDGRRQCSLLVEANAQGVPCLVLSLQAALAKPKVSVRSGSEQSVAQPTAKTAQQIAASKLPTEAR